MRQQTNFKVIATECFVTMRSKTIGETAKRLREDAGWSQSELARRVGVKPQNIQQLEDGTVNQPRYLKDLARVFHRSIDELFEESGLARPTRKKEVPDYAIRLAQRISSVTPEQIRAINVIIDSGPEKSKAILTLLDAKEELRHTKEELPKPEQTAAPAPPRPPSRRGKAPERS